MTFSLSAFYLKRVLTNGKWYIVIGLMFPIVLTVGILVQGPNSSGLFSTFSSFAFLMPITGIWGMIPLVFFLVGDRRTGFFEHIFATTEVSVHKIYGSLLKDSVIITSIPVVFILALSFGFFVSGISLPHEYFILLIAYSLPVSYITPLVVLAVAATWSFTTRVIRGPFSNGPAGFVPLIGIVIVLIPLYLQNYQKIFPLVELMALYSLSIFLVLIALVVFSMRTMKPERFLP